MQRVLLLGGHGKVSLFLTPKLLSRSLQVTSVVRNSAHTAEIEGLAAGQPGHLSVLTRSLDDIQTEQAARAVLDEAKPDTVVFSAGGCMSSLFLRPRGAPAL